MEFKTGKLRIDLGQPSDIEEKAAEVAENIVLSFRDDNSIRQALEFFMRVSSHICALSDHPDELVAYFGTLVKDTRDGYEEMRKDTKEKGNGYPGGYYS